MLSGARAAELPNGGGMRINSADLDHRKTPGPWELRPGFGRDTGVVFKAGGKRIQWCYDMESRISVVTDSKDSRPSGPHRMALVQVLVTARVYFCEKDKDSAMFDDLEWLFAPISVAFVAERIEDRIEVRGPVGPSSGFSKGMSLGVDFKVEEIQNGRAYDYGASPDAMSVFPAKHGVSVSFNALRPDFTRFDKEAAFQALEKRLELKQGSVFRNDPVGSTNNMRPICFFAVDR